ncbi:MAG: helix-turn-helix domain-containing protein [Alphaproteobacteria bacterium]|nr:helix-turn-helix domain-containing protein [Alphaproteobacteria bacterium]
MNEAATTLRRLPAHGPSGHRSSWPRPLRDAADLADCVDPPRLRLRPSPDAIDRLDLVLGWMPWLAADQVKLLWARALGVPWRRICLEFGFGGRTSAWRAWVAALATLSARLTRERVAVPRPYVGALPPDRFLPNS